MLLLLLRGMRAGTLDVHRTMSMVAIEGAWELEGMLSMWILKSEVLVESRVGIVESRQVKTRLGREWMVSQVRLAVLYCLSCLRLQRTICVGLQLSMKDSVGLHPALPLPCLMHGTSKPRVVHAAFMIRG
jgi:hypothetical protein